MSEPIVKPHVSVPNSERFVEVVTDFVRSMCRTAKVADRKVNRLCLAVEEAFLNAVQHGFPDDQTSFITLQFSLLADKVCASLRYSGYPLDPELLPSNPTLQGDGSGKGLGLLFMHTMVDQVEFINHGSKGQETRLTMYMGTRLEAPEAESMDHASTGRSERIPYSIRPLKPEEAVEVARLAYLSYGDTYPYEDIYYPDRIRELNELGRLRSFVAVTDDGEIISHAALAHNEETNPGMAELGLAFTKPSRRGLGCMNKLWEALLDEARNMGLFGAFILAVTSHPYTQKCSHGYGFSDCAFLAAEVPGLRFNKISDANERESILVECQLFKEPKPVLMYAPENHQEIITSLCGKLGVTPRFESAEGSPMPDSGRVNVITKPAFGTATFTVAEFGKNTFSKIQSTTLSLLMNGNAPIFLHIPMNSPHAPKLVDQLEHEPGWFFAGIMPNKQVGFELVMQHTGKYQLDYSKLASASEDVDSLLAYVRDYDERARKITQA